MSEVVIISFSYNCIIRLASYKEQLILSRVKFAIWSDLLGSPLGWAQVSREVHGVIRDDRPGVCVMTTTRGIPPVHRGIVVLMNLKLEPTLMVPEIGGTQASLINSLSDYAKTFNS